MKIFSLFGEILLRDTGVKDKLAEIDKAGEKTSGGLSGAFGKIGGAALKLAGIVGVGLTFKAMIDGASKGQERMAQMDAVLKSTGGAAGMTKDELVKLAEAQGKLTKFSKGANIESENLLLTFTGIGKKVFPEALSMVNDMSQALGQDTKSSCIQLGKALNDPVQGMTALSRVGVSFTEAQKEQIKAMQEAGDVEGAQAIILAELKKEFGGSAEAAGKTFGGQMTILKNSISGVVGQIGGLLLPYLTEFVTFINNNMPAIKEAINKAFDVAKNVMKVVADVIKTILIPAFNSIRDWVSAHKDDITNIFQVIADFVNNKLIPALKTVADWVIAHKDDIKNAFDTLNDVIKTIIDKLVDLGKAAQDAYDFLSKHQNLAVALAIVVGALALAILVFNAASIWATISTGIMTAATGIWTTVAGIGTAVTLGFGAAVAFLTSPITLVILAIGLLIAAGYLLYKHWDEIKAKAIEVWNMIKVKVGEMVASAKQKFEEFKSAISNKINEIKSKVSDTFNNIKSTIQNKIQDAKNTVESIFDGIKNSITNKINGAKQAVSDAINAIKGFFNIKLELPHFKLPHFTFSGSMNPMKWADEGVPHIGVNWYAKGGIFNAPSVIGVGEAGTEAVLPIDRLDEIIAKAIEKAGGVGNNRPQIIQVVLPDGRVLAEEVAKNQDVIDRYNSRNLGGALI